MVAARPVSNPFRKPRRRRVSVLEAGGAFRARLAVRNRIGCVALCVLSGAGLRRGEIHPPAFTRPMSALALFLPYRLQADLLVLLHFAFILFGGLCSVFVLMYCQML